MYRSRYNTEICNIFGNIKDSIKDSIKIFNNYLKKIYIPYNINKELDKLYEKDVKKLHNDIYEAIWNITNNSNNETNEETNKQKIKRIVIPKCTTHNINNYSKKYDNTNINFAELYNIKLYNNITFNYNSHKIMLKPYLEDNNIIVYEITCV